MGITTANINLGTKVIGGVVWIAPVQSMTPKYAKPTVAGTKATIKIYIRRLAGNLNLGLTSSTLPIAKLYYGNVNFKNK